jgi:hypothetical protein
MSISNAELTSPIEQSIELLGQRARAIEERSGSDLEPVIASDGLSDLMPRVIRITQELFPGDVSAYVLNDPEYPDVGFTVIEAQANGPAEGLVDRQVEWHKRMLRLSPSCATLRLTFNYHE